MSDINLPGKVAVNILKSSAASALSKGKAINGFVALASDEGGDLTGPISNFGTAKHLIGEVCGGLPIGVGLRLWLPGMVHKNEDRSVSFRIGWTTCRRNSDASEVSDRSQPA